MKLDLVRTHKSLYNAPSAPHSITVPEGQFIAITGKGDPNGAVFAARVQALYTAVYSIKNACKRKQQDFTVPKLEGLWWVDEYHLLNGYRNALAVPREEWNWQLLIRMPDFVSAATARQAINDAFAGKPLPLLREVSLISFEEGPCVQVMHHGPYREEPATLELLDGYIMRHGLKRNGRHHEIYLSDPRRATPEKMRTILRQPVK